MITRRLSIVGIILFALRCSANSEGNTKDAKPTDHYRGLSRQHYELVDEFEKEYPKLFSTWCELRDLQKETIRLNDVFGVKARKEAERSSASLKLKYHKLRQHFLGEIARIRQQLGLQKKPLDDRVMRMRQVPLPTSESQRQANESQLESLHRQLGKLNDRLLVLSVLEGFLTQAARALPDRTTQLTDVGLQSADSPYRRQAALFAPAIEALASVKDCLTDIQTIETRKDTPEWQPADERALTTLQTQLDAAISNLNREVEKLKKPHETEKAKHERRLAGINRSIEIAQKSKRSTKQYDQQASKLRQEIADAEASIRAVAELADWKARLTKPKKR